jgi:hypothetical protein
MTGRVVRCSAAELLSPFAGSDQTHLPDQMAIDGDARLGAAAREAVALRKDLVRASGVARQRAS